MSLPEQPVPQFSDTVKDVVQFLRRPRLPEVPTTSHSLIVFGQVLVLSFMLSFGVLLLLGALKEAGLVPEIPHQMEDFLKETHFLLVLLLVAVVMPALEEFAFRLWLVYNPLYFLVSLWLVCFFLASALMQVELAIAGYIILGIAAMLTALILALKEQAGQLLQQLYSRQYGWVLYGATVLFALLHIINFKSEAQALLFAPLLVLPQLLLGLLLAYIRVRQGMTWAIVLHGLYNAIILSLAYIGMQAPEVPTP